MKEKLAMGSYFIVSAKASLPISLSLFPFLFLSFFLILFLSFPLPLPSTLRLRIKISLFAFIPLILHCQWTIKCKHILSKIAKANEAFRRNVVEIVIVLPVFVLKKIAKRRENDSFSQARDQGARSHPHSVNANFRTEVKWIRIGCESDRIRLCTYPIHIRI